MGFWNLFKPKEKENIKLLKLQNIIYGENYNGILLPQQQILNDACNIYVPQITRMINDSIELVTDSAVPDTFFFRLDFLIEKFKELVIIEDLIVFTPPLPSAQLNDIMDKYDLTIQQFLERYAEKCVTEISKLKTKKGKMNKIEKFTSELLEYKSKFTTSHLEYVDSILKNEFNIDFYENNKSLEIITEDINLASNPYYLDENLKIDPFELAEERKQVDFLSSNNKDKKYYSYIDTLSKIKKSITYEYDDKNIELCKNGLNLATELCNYCIDKNYHSSKFVIYETKDYYDYFKDQLEYKIMNLKYNNASVLEKQGYFEKALEIYLNILDEYSPSGYNYYSYPFNLAITIFDYNSASKIYTYLRNTIETRKIVNLNDLIERFDLELKEVNSTENLYPSIKEKIINIINKNPGIIQTDMYTELGTDNKESYRFILYYWEQLNIIKREKSGRSYKIFLSN